MRRRRSDESLDTAETGDFFLPFLCSEDGFDDGREDGLDGVGVDRLDDGQSSGGCGVLDWDHLIANGGEDGWEEDDEVWLDGGGGFGMLSDSLDGIESSFPYVGIFLVSELLLQRFDGSVGILVSNFSATVAPSTS